jgi:hypothetical protein
MHTGIDTAISCGCKVVGVAIMMHVTIKDDCRSLLLLVSWNAATLFLPAWQAHVLQPRCDSTHMHRPGVPVRSDAVGASRRLHVVWCRCMLP